LHVITIAKMLDFMHMQNISSSTYINVQTWGLGCYELPMMINLSIDENMN
jgi:hypothetical protein